MRAAISDCKVLWSCLPRVCSSEATLGREVGDVVEDSNVEGDAVVIEFRWAREGRTAKVGVDWRMKLSKVAEDISVAESKSIFGWWLVRKGGHVRKELRRN